MPNIGADVSLHAAPHLMGYIDNGDGTVTDTVTHLIWQQVVDPTKTYSVDDARNYCAVTLSKSGLGGYHDWRLPSLIELISLIDYGHPAPGPMINGTFFPGTPSGTSDPFWSTTRFSAASGWQPCDGRRPSKAMTHRSSQRSEIVAWSTRSSSLEAGVDHDAAHVSLEK